MVDLHSKQRKRPCEETQSGCITLLLKQHISMVIAEQHNYNVCQCFQIIISAFFRVQRDIMVARL